MNEELTQNSMQYDTAQEIEVKHQCNFNEEDYGENPYFQKNPEMFKELWTLKKNINPHGFCKILRANCKIMNWFHEVLTFLDNDYFKFEDYSASEMTYLVLNGMNFFPICPICGNPLKNPRVFCSGRFLSCCSKECGMKQKAKSFKETSLRLYGVDHPYKNKEQYQKYCDVMEQRYGVRNSYQKENTKAQIKKTKLERHGDENYVNCEKAKITRYTKYDGKYESNETKKKRKDTFIEHYGVDNNMKSEVGRKEYEDAIEQKYGKGIRNISQSETIKQKKKETCQKNFGVDWPQQNEDVRKKTYDTCFNKYGYPIAMQNPEIRNKARSKYFYDERWFDSAPEIAYYIWLKDNNIQFEYHPNVCFQYEHDGKIHNYQPDFLVERQYIEIKGDHFFKEDGTMQNPYDLSQSSTLEAKHQCMLKNNVKIMKSNEYSKYIKYVKMNYGISFIHKLKKCK